MLGVSVSKNAVEPAGLSIAVDDDGFLINTYDWTPVFSEIMATKKRLVLSDRHWALINLVRYKFKQTGKIPSIGVICKSIGFRKSDLKFEIGGCVELWKMAGLPNPGLDGCDCLENW